MMRPALQSLWTSTHLHARGDQCVGRGKRGGGLGLTHRHFPISLQPHIPPGPAWTCKAAAIPFRSTCNNRVVVIAISKAATIPFRSTCNYRVVVIAISKAATTPFRSTCNYRVVVIAVSKAAATPFKTTCADRMVSRSCIYTPFVLLHRAQRLLKATHRSHNNQIPTLWCRTVPLNFLFPICSIC